MFTIANPIYDELLYSDNEPLIHRLSLAIADEAMQENAIEEENFDRVLLKELGQEFTKGLVEGLEKGKAEGIAEGLEKGIEANKIETAQKMKALGLSIEQITNLSIQAISAL